MYTKDNLRRELALIYRNPQTETWSARGVQEQVNFDELAEYCWVVYQKALTASGFQVIGRVQDINQGMMKVFAHITGPEISLIDKGVKGNILHMHKWALVLNDCWLLGGVHRRAQFLLSSKLDMRNLWDNGHRRLVVTGREIIGLLHFGYECIQPGGGLSQSHVYVCRNAALAGRADLESYHLAVALRETMGPAGATAGLLEAQRAAQRGAK